MKNETTLEEEVYRNVPHYNDYFQHDGLNVGKPYCLKSAVKHYGKEVIKDCLGLYHLFFEGRLVYIGMSKNLRTRLLYHLKDTDMVFDAVLIFPAPERSIEQVLKIETKLIKRYKPSLNQACINSGY